MSNNLNGSPTPIQRNSKDVAIDLIKIYLDKGDYTTNEITEDRLIELYKKFHTAATEAVRGK